MAPGLSYTSYTTAGREVESSARKTNGMEKKTDTNSRTAFQTKATPTSNYRSTVGVFRFKITL